MANRKRRLAFALRNLQTATQKLLPGSVNPDVSAPVCQLRILISLESPSFLETDNKHNGIFRVCQPSDFHTSIRGFDGHIIIGAAVLLKSGHMLEQYRCVRGQVAVDDLQDADKVQAAFTR